MQAECHGDIFSDSFRFNPKLTGRDMIVFAQEQWECSEEYIPNRFGIKPINLKTSRAFWRGYFKTNPSHGELAGAYCGELFSRDQWDELEFILSLLRADGGYGFDS